MSNIEELRGLRCKIGKNIQQVRIKRNMTVHQCAKRMELKPIKLDQYEMGKNMVSLEMLVYIAKELGVPLHRLFE